MSADIRNYPHGLDDDILADDLEVEQENVTELEPDLEAAIEDENALLLDGLAESYYFSACYSYALGESPESIKPLLTKALETWFQAFQFGLIIDVYEFIRLLSLARVLGNREIAETLAAAGRERYTDEDVEADETTFAVAALLCALIVRDDRTTESILAKHDPNAINADKIYRYDRMIYFPLLRLLRAIHQMDAADFAAGLQEREKQFVAFFKRADEKNDPEALIDLPGTALATIARRRNLNFADASVYRPRGL